jgi:tetratricopeptide (TPR) repeat protein
MRWFKKVFQNSTVESEVEFKVSKEVKIESVSEFTSTTSSDIFFSGLDYDFINFIYFKDETEKIKFISDVEKLLIELKINCETNMVSGRKKVFESNYNLDKIIPFLDRIICYNSYVTTTTIKELNKEKIEKSIKTKFETHNNLENYYTALNLCSYNLEKKIENNFFNFKFEEELVNNTLEKSNLYNFARVNTLFNLGNSFYKACQIENMENIFNKIRMENYELSSSTVAGYYRNIGEIYMKLKQNDKALDWLKAGLTLNPKLGVKKLIDKLDKK